LVNRAAGHPDSAGAEPSSGILYSRELALAVLSRRSSQLSNTYTECAET
jgi:hypothetical protein